MAKFCIMEKFWLLIIFIGIFWELKKIVSVLPTRKITTARNQKEKNLVVNTVALTAQYLLFIKNNSYKWPVEFSSEHNGFDSLDFAIH